MRNTQRKEMVRVGLLGAVVLTIGVMGFSTGNAKAAIQAKATFLVKPIVTTDLSPNSSNTLTRLTMIKATKVAKTTSKKAKKTETKKKTQTKKKTKKYVPISKGWKTSKSVVGDMTADQKAALDQMIVDWKAKKLTDNQLKSKMENYLQEQNIDYMEVSVTSKGKALYEKIPKLDWLRGGNLYSFCGTYCTGKKNPGGTNKTVCYNWSAFVF